MTVTPYQAVPAGLGNGTPPARRQQGLSLMVHALYKSGKSSLGDSGPVPRLVMDVETAAFWTPSRKVYWDPARQTCPVPDGTWDTCIVIIHSFAELKSMLEFLNRGQHPFNSVTLDSVTTIQQRIMYQLAGDRKMERDQWYAMLRMVNMIISGYRDLITHPYRPVWAVTYVCGTHWDARMGKFRPLLQGQASDYLPYVPDVLGWIEVRPDRSRTLLIGPSPVHETGERVWGRLPLEMPIGYPGRIPGWTVEDMVLQVINS